MNGIVLVRVPVQPLEDVLDIAVIVHRTELRRIEESPAVHHIKAGARSVSRRTDAYRPAAGSCTERAVAAIDVAVQLLAQAVDFVVVCTTRLALSPYSAGGTPLITFMLSMELSAIWLENWRLC